MKKKLNPRAVSGYLQATLRYGWYTRHPFLMKFDERLRPYIAKRICQMYTKDVIYFRIPKCANSTIVNTIATCELGRTIDGFDYKSYYNNLPSIDTISESFKFTFVRNPYTRALSAYRDKVIFSKKYKKIHKMRHFFKDSESVSFDDFLRLLDDGFLHQDIHWAPQTSIVDFSDLNFIGHIEQLDHDMKHVMGELGIPYDKVETAKRRRTGSSFTDVTQAQKSVIEKLYREDFEVLGVY